MGARFHVGAISLEQMTTMIRLRAMLDPQRFTKSISSSQNKRALFSSDMRGFHALATEAGELKKLANGS